MKKALAVVLIGGLILSGCSTFKNTAHYLGLGEPDAPRYAVTHQQLVDFVSGIRPVRGNPDAHYRLAGYYLERGLYREALDEYQKVTAIDPAYIKAYNGMGIVYDALKDYGRAAQAYEMALSINPSLVYVYNNLGYSRILAGDYDAAIAVLEKAAVLEGATSRIHNNLGKAYALKRQFDRALTEFEQAGDKVRAHFNVAQLYFQAGMISEARNHYTDALRLDPGYVGAQKGMVACNLMVSPHMEAQSAKSQQAKVHSEKTAADLKDARVEISNGNGIRHMAKNAGKYLRGKGFNVVRLTNAKNFNNDNAGVYYQEDYKAAALLLAKKIPGVHRVKRMTTSNRSDIHIKVLLGKDIVSYKKIFENRS
jgi:tetratricopeptide (TPR) repeat protein